MLFTTCNNTYRAGLFLWQERAVFPPLTLQASCKVGLPLPGGASTQVSYLSRQLPEFYYFYGFFYVVYAEDVGALLQGYDVEGSGAVEGAFGIDAEGFADHRFPRYSREYRPAEHTEGVEVV